MVEGEGAEAEAEGETQGWTSLGPWDLETETLPQAGVLRQADNLFPRETRLHAMALPIQDEEAEAEAETHGETNLGPWDLETETIPQAGALRQADKPFP